MGGIAGNRENRTINWLIIATIVSISLLGCSVIYYATRWGPWVYSDSTEYIVSAQNLIAGRGLGLYGPSGTFHPSILHPPFYSLVLSLFGFLGFDLVTAARWINIILFGSVILLASFSIYYLTRSAWLSIISSLMLLTMPAMVDAFSGAMSEPVFLFTGLVSIILIVLYTRDTRAIYLLGAIIAAALSMLTRYNGLVFVIAGMLILLVYSQEAWKKRMLSAAVFGFASLLPTLVWLIWVRTQTLEVRSIQFGIYNLARLAQFRLSVMPVIWSWLPFSSQWPGYSYNLARNIFTVLVILLLVLVSITFIKLRRSKEQVASSVNGFQLAFILVSTSIISVFILAFSYLYTSPSPDLNERTLLPIHIMALLAVFSLLLFFIKSWNINRWAAIVPILLALGYAVPQLQQSLSLISSYHQYGAGYTSEGWRKSETVGMVNQLPSNIPIISNESSLILFSTGRPAYDLYNATDPVSQLFSAPYGTDLKDPNQQVFREKGAALVLFNTSLWQFQKIYGSQAAEMIKNLTHGLTLFGQTEDGSIYFYPMPK